jgi:hypothetical protein
MVPHQTPNCRPSAYDPGVMDAKHVLERVAGLKQEMQDLRVANARLDEPRHSKGNYESRLSRLENIKAELAEMLYEFKRTGTD